MMHTGIKTPEFEKRKFCYFQENRQKKWLTPDKSM